MKVLLFRPTPRGNIPEVEQYNKDFPCDVLHVKYTIELLAYTAARKYFLENDYDYFIIAPDDLVVRPEDVTHIVSLCEKYDVISGLCNVSEMQLTETGVTNIITTKLPQVHPSIIKNGKLVDICDEYDWVRRDELPEGIFQALFSGFALMAIKRSIIEKFEFLGHRSLLHHNNRLGTQLDLVFCHWCKGMNIPIYVDRDLDLVHLRYSGIMEVGIKFPEVWLNNYQQPPNDYDLEWKN